MIGGSGERRTLRLVAQYADMCNVTGGPDTLRAQARRAAPPLRRRRARPGRDHHDAAGHARAHTRRRRDRARAQLPLAASWATSSTSSSSSASPTTSCRRSERSSRRASTASSSTCRSPTPDAVARAGELLVAALRVDCACRDDSRRAARLRARRQAAHHQLRRPRLDALGERRGVRSAPRRRRHQRDADGPVPVGTRRGGDVPGRGRRRAPHAERGVGRRTAGGRSPTRRACSTATAGSRARSPTSGTTPTSTRCARSAGPRSSGPSTGASTSPTSTATWARCSSAPTSSTSTSSWPSTSASRCAWRARAAERMIGFPYRRLAERRRRRVPRPLRVHARRLAAGDRTHACSTSRPGVTEIYLHPAIDTDELRASHPDWASARRGPRVR